MVRSVPFPRMSRRTVGELTLFFVVAAIVVLSVCRPDHRTRAVLALMLAALLIAVTAWMPRRILVYVAITVVFVPYGVIRSTGQYPGEVTALLATLLAVGVALNGHRRTVRPTFTAVDGFVCLMALLMLGAVLVRQQSFDSWLQEMVLWIGPYSCTRMLGVSKRNLQSFARALVASGCALVPFVVLEAANGDNVFRHLAPGEAAFYKGAAAAVRGGGRRASASFFSPIALAMFLAVAIMLGIGLAIESKSRRGRWGWGSAAALLTATLFLTVSRTSWLMLGVGTLGAVAFIPSVRIRRRILTAIPLLLIVVVLLARLGPSSVSTGIPLVGRSTAETRGSSQYRSELLQKALDQGLLHPLGNRSNNLANLVDENYASVDNEYLLLADQFGYLSAIALLGVLLVFLLFAASTWAPDVLSALYLAAGSALLVTISTVAFLTQQQVLVWLILGACSAILASSPRTLLLRRSRPSAAASLKLGASEQQPLLS